MYAQDMKLKADPAEMIVAYAALPRLADVQDVLIASASRFGSAVAHQLHTIFHKVAQSEVAGIRVFTENRELPVYRPAPGPGPKTAWADPSEVIEPASLQIIGGLIRPLPDGAWEYTYLNATGGTTKFVLSTTSPEPELEEVPLAAAQYTTDPVELGLSREFVRVGVGIADHMRKVADRVERHARDIRPSIYDQKLDHNLASAEIIHDINNLQGNLNTSGLLRAAAEADRHTRGSEA